MTISGAVAELHNVLKALDDKCGELAEVHKAENIAFHENFHGTNVTEARENAKRAAAEFYREAIDLQCDIDSLNRWREYWTLRIDKGV